MASALLLLGRNQKKFYLESSQSTENRYLLGLPFAQQLTRKSLFVGTAGYSPSCRLWLWETRKNHLTSKVRWVCFIGAEQFLASSASLRSLASTAV